MIRTNERRRQFVEAVSAAINARKRARKMLSENDLSTREEMILTRQHELNRKAKSLLDQEADSEQVLRIIFDQWTDLNREIKQLRLARRLRSHRSTTQNSFVLRAVRERNAAELRSTQKLLSASGVSEIRLHRFEAKLKLLEEHEDEQLLVDEGTGEAEETEFSCWLEDLKTTNKTMKCLPSVQHLESRLEALKEIPPLHLE